MLKKIFISIIVLPLLIVPLFCACTQQASASIIGVEHCHDDEDSSSATHHDESGPGHEHACNCGHALNAVFEKPTTSQAVLSFAPNSFPVPIFIEPASVVLLKGSMHLAYLGPPGRAFEVPLYTQYHSLRI